MVEQGAPGVPESGPLWATGGVSACSSVSAGKGEGAISNGDFRGGKDIPRDSVEVSVAAKVTVPAQQYVLTLSAKKNLPAI